MNEKKSTIVDENIVNQEQEVKEVRNLLKDNVAALFHDKEKLKQYCDFTARYGMDRYSALNKVFLNTKKKIME